MMMVLQVIVVDCSYCMRHTGNWGDFDWHCGDCSQPTTSDCRWDRWVNKDQCSTCTNSQ